VIRRALSYTTTLLLPPLAVWGMASAANVRVPDAARAKKPREHVIMASVSPAPGVMPAPVAVPSAQRGRAARRDMRRAAVAAAGTQPAGAPADSTTAQQTATARDTPHTTPTPAVPAQRPPSSRDPFVSLLAGTFEGTENTPVFDVGELRLVGILWGETDRFALVQNPTGRGTALRPGDRLVNGYVESLTPTSVTVVEESRRGARRIVLHLKETGDDSAAQ